MQLPWLVSLDSKHGVCHCRNANSRFLEIFGELQMDYSDRGTVEQLFVDSLRDCALVLLDVDGKVLSWERWRACDAWVC